jgi:hypothetical protein
MINQYKKDVAVCLKKTIDALGDRNLELTGELQEELRKIEHEIKYAGVRSPAPWDVINNYVLDSRGRCIAELTQNLHTQADAKLIAVAPEMLALLIEIVEEGADDGQIEELLNRIM